MKSIYEHAFNEQQKLLEQQNRAQFLVPVAPSKPIPGGSLTWTFEAKNILGWTLGSLTFYFDWVAEHPCVIKDEKWGLIASKTFTAPLINVGQSDVNIVQFERDREDCEDGKQDAIRFNIAVDFEGPVNNIPYRNYLEVFADGTWDFGPK